MDRLVVTRRAVRPRSPAGARSEARGFGWRDPGTCGTGRCPACGPGRDRQVGGRRGDGSRLARPGHLRHGSLPGVWTRPRPPGGWPSGGRVSAGVTRVPAARVAARRVDPAATARGVPSEATTTDGRRAVGGSARWCPRSAAAAPPSAGLNRARALSAPSYGRPGCQVRAAKRESAIGGPAATAPNGRCNLSAVSASKRSESTPPGALAAIRGAAGRQDRRPTWAAARASQGGAARCEREVAQWTRWRRISG